MDLTWANVNFLYYTCKSLGLFPLAGNRKYLSLAYSAVVWSILLLAICQITFEIYLFSHDASGFQLWLKMLFVEVCIKGITAVFTIIISAHKSSNFLALLDKFNTFNRFSLQIKCEQNRRAQLYYTLYIGFIVVYHYFSVFGLNKVRFHHIFWPISCCVNTLVSVQYAILMSMLRKKHEMANILFKSCMNNTGTNMQFMYPSEIDRLFTELQYITNEIKGHYTANTILFVVETTAIFVSNVTLLSCHAIFTSSVRMNIQTFLLSVFRLIFFFFFVREAHNTVQSTKQTVLIAHEALPRINNAIISKKLDMFIMNCWNHPIVFDVYNLFDLDYQLIHSIFGAVATYTVVLVQIQLAFLKHTSKADSIIV